MSNGMIHVQRSFREFARVLKKYDWLKVDFWLQGRPAADTSHSGTIFDQSDARRHPVSWILIGRKSFHCAMYLLPLGLVSKNQLGVLLLLHIVGQGPAVLAAGAGRVGYIFFIHLPSLSNVLSFGRRLNMTEILLFRLLNPNGSPRLVLVNRLEGLSLPKNRVTIN